MMHKSLISLTLSFTLLLSDQQLGYPKSAKKVIDCGEPPPPVAKVNAPRTPIIFTSNTGRDRQKLSLFYRRAGSVDFEYESSGRCQRHVKGMAKLKPCWWLGAEIDENEDGEAYRVQEYVYEGSGSCTMYLRIAEEDWQAASVHDVNCGKTCPALPKQMHLQKQ